MLLIELAVLRREQVLCDCNGCVPFFELMIQLQLNKKFTQIKLIWYKCEFYQTYFCKYACLEEITMYKKCNRK